MPREEIIRCVRDWANGLNEPVRVYFFGSRHKGTNRKDSDVDIAVESSMQTANYSEYTNYWWDRREIWKTRLEELLGLEVDFQPYDPRETPCMKKYLAAGSGIIFDSIGQ